MSRLEWKPEYQTNVGTVDTQHKRLFELMAALDDAVTAGQGTPVIAQTLKGLVAYVHEHFSYEEILFRDNNYSRTEEHKALHDQLKRRIADYLRDIQSRREVSPFELLAFLKAWVGNHILTSDFHYAMEFRERGVTVGQAELADFLSSRSKKSK
jgi:hemerythrin